jgi:diguanylate cyclase (GGDEF)-like protein
MSWLSDFELFARIADDLETIGSNVRLPDHQRRSPQGAAALRARLEQVDESRFSSPTARTDFASAKVYLLDWANSRPGLAYARLGESFASAARALRSAAAALVKARSEHEQRLAWLYQMYVLRSEGTPLVLLESGMPATFNVSAGRIAEWIQWAVGAHYIELGSSGRDRGFSLTTDGAEEVERTFEEAATLEQAAPARAKQQKFGILDAPNLLPDDLADLLREPSLLGSSLLFFDLDDFKSLNTRFSETVVDAAIVIPMHTLVRDAAQGNGFAYAFGGDEFIMLLPNTPHEVALVFAEHLRRRIAAVNLRVNGQEVQVTASFGIASTDAWPVDELKEAANMAMRRAKAQGKNTVIAASLRGSQAP